MRFGCHVSIAGSIDQAFDRAGERGCDAFQIFVRNPRGWAVQPLPPDAVKLFKEKRKATGMGPIVVHITYLPNLASPDDVLYEKSTEYLTLELRMANDLGADYFVTHLGHHKGSGVEAGIRRIADAVNAALTAVNPKTVVLLENTAGGTGSVGDTFEEIAAILSRVRKKSKVGLCFDTCHAFAAGYNVRTERGLEETLQTVDKTVGLSKLLCVHANDSMFDLDQRKDRHQHIGEGFLGDEGLSVIVNHPFFQDKPFILETPVETIEDDLRNLARLRGLWKGGGGGLRIEE